MANVIQNQILTGDRESFITCRNSQGGEVRATAVRLTRFTAVFEVYNPYSILQLSEVLGEFRIIVADRCVYAGRAVVSNLVNTGIMVLCEATLDESWLDVDVFSPITQPDRLRQEFEIFMSEWQKTRAVTPEFKVAVADFQTLLMDLRGFLDQVELGVRSEPMGTRAEMERTVLRELEGQILPEVDGWLQRFDVAAGQVGDEVRPAHRAYARRQLHPLVMCSPFVYRTFHKPLGYAGDYEVVNMILRDPHEGATMFAKMVNVFFLLGPPAIAHRNRIQLMKQRLIDETRRVTALGRRIKILNLGCGPAREVEEFMMEEELSDRADFQLLDFNPQTLEYTRNVLTQVRMKYGRTTNLTFEEKSINQLLKEAIRPETVLQKGAYDLVYCAGLFDYVSDRVCKRLTDLFFEYLAPGGLMLLTNVHDGRPFRQLMDFVLEWHLNYRDAEQMKYLLPPSKVPLEFEVRADPTGVNVFLEVRKQKPV